MRAVAPALMVSPLALSEGPLLHKLHSVSGLELVSLLQRDHVLLLGARGPVSEAPASEQAKLARVTKSAQDTQSLGVGRSQDSP